ncbi:peptide chain release factor 2 [bacterium]|nr:peptide chain release factor 2 [bacterium]
MNFQNSGKSYVVKSPTCGGIFDVDRHKVKTAEFDKLATKEGFWDDPDEAQKILKAGKKHRTVVDRWESLNTDITEFEIYIEMLEEDFEGTVSEAETTILTLQKRVAELELATMLSGKDDAKDCILTIKPGAGGTESQDWTQMLMRMYLRYLERREFDYEVIDLQPGEEAGIKYAAIEISGDHPFGYLRAEAGVHRLVRISPFDSNARRHTSFASVFVYPEVEEVGEVEINPADLRIDTYRASGAGGQHVNKTDSAVRLTHLPTGLVATCQSERSQHRNKDAAMKFLRAKLYQKQLEEEEKKKAALDESKQDIAWGSQIRSYVFHPYKMVKDLRTGVETSNVEQVMDGDIHEFITSYLIGMKR